MKGSIVIRMYKSTFDRIKREFPSVRGETMVSYFERLSKYLKEQDNRRINERIISEGLEGGYIVK